MYKILYDEGRKEFRSTILQGKAMGNSRTDLDVYDIVQVWGKIIWGKMGIGNAIDLQEHFRQPPEKDNMTAIGGDSYNNLWT